MSSNPAAVVRVRKMPIVVVSNDGASSSRDCGKAQSQEIAESSPPQGSSSPTISDHSTEATSNISIYSDRDEPSTCQLLAPREHAPNGLARRACVGSTRYPTPVPDSLHERGSSAWARADSPEPTSQPTLMSSLRLSLAAFVSRLFAPSKKGEHAPALSKAHEGDRKEPERLHRWSASRAFLPLR